MVRTPMALGFLMRIPVPIFQVGGSVIQVKVEAAQAPYHLGNLSEGSLVSVCYPLVPSDRRTRPTSPATKETMEMVNQKEIN